MSDIYEFIFMSNRPIDDRITLLMPVKFGHIPIGKLADENTFLALPANKADLARFLSEQLTAQAPDTKTIVVAGGFRNEEKVESSNPEVDTDKLAARQEEADTRLIFHCVENQAGNIVVQASDTDVLVVLLANFHRMQCTKLWLKAGTAKERKYIPIHTIVDQMLYGPTVLGTILAFHALTGSDDTTSYISGHSKKTAWMVFQEHHELLQNLGKGELTDEIAKDAEQFVCRVYKVQNVNTVDEARPILFIKSHAPESLPPTSDALSFHIKLSHYQAAVWRQAHLNYPDLPSPESMGWRYEDDFLVPVLMSLSPVPDACREVVSCGCNTGCGNLRCKCRKSDLLCTGACKCRNVNDNCRNT